MSNKYALSAEDVSNYLIDNKDFFDRFPETLTALNLRHDLPGTSSLIERQVTQLREQNEKLRCHLRNLLENARNNDELFEKTRKLSLILNQNQSLEDLTRSLKNCLEEDFKAEYYSLILFDQDEDSDSDSLRFVNSSTASEQAPALINVENVLCGHLKQNEYEFLFPTGYEKIHSAIIIPIQLDGLKALIALGSEDGNRFHSQLGTLFADYIGEVVGGPLAKALTEELEMRV